MNFYHYCSTLKPFAMKKKLKPQRSLLDTSYRSERRDILGFTLPELLVAGLIAAVVAIMSTRVMTSQLVQERRLELGQRIRENTSRLNYLVQIEASEASEIETGVAMANSCPAGISGFTFWIPRPTGVYADDVNRSAVHYFNAGGNVMRCGPPVTRNGVLNHQVASVTGVVVRNAQLNVNPNGCAVPINGRQVVYTLVYPDGTVGDSAQCAIAHARSVFVCNPPLDPLNPAQGDCVAPPPP